MIIDKVYEMEKREFDDALDVLMRTDEFVRVLAILIVRTQPPPPFVLEANGLNAFNFDSGRRDVVLSMQQSVNDSARVPALNQEVQRYEHRRNSAERGPRQWYDVSVGGDPAGQ